MSHYSYESGVFLSRLQPPTNAHLECIQYLLEECQQGILFIGSSNTESTPRNPFSCQLRQQMTTEAIEDNFEKTSQQRLRVVPLPDLTYANNPNNGPEWGQYLYQKVNELGIKNFAFFGGELKSLWEWFGHPEVQPHVSTERFRPSEKIAGLSATKVRQALQFEDRQYVQQNCPHSAYSRFDQLREIYLRVLADAEK